MPPSVIGCPFLSSPHPVLDLGEGLLDRIEVWRIGRQIPEPGAGGLDHTAEDGRLVAAEIVHDDDVAGLEQGQELLFDVSAEAFAIDGSIEHARGAELVAAQRAKEG